MDVLCVLAERAGEVVPREHLIDRLWVSEFGADESLTRAVSLIRKALREGGQGSDAIETIKKRGYRLQLPVEFGLRDGVEPAHPIESADVQSVPDRAEEGTKRRGSRWALSLLPLLGVAAVWLLNPGGKPPDSETGAQETTPSVAVLPFEALSEDDSDAFFGAGVAEEILNALSRFPDLKVIARTSAFAVDRDRLEASDIGSLLGVDHLLTGSVRREGRRIRLSAQLIRAVDRSSLWSNTYEVDEADVFAAEDDIVRDVAATLQVRLGVGSAAGRNDGVGVDPIAYEQYLQGLRYWGERMRRNGNREAALAAFQRAVSFDPEFADAWAGIGSVGVFSVGSPLSRNRTAFLDMTRQALNRAIELDPDNAKAHSALMVFHVMQQIDVDAARHHYEQARTSAPNAATTQYAAGMMHRALGEADAAIAAFDRARVLDPLNAVIGRVRAELLIEIGRHEEGMAFFEQCYESRCLGEGFIVYASAAAVFTGESRHIERWRPRLDEFEAQVAELPDSRKPQVAKIMPAFFSLRLQRDDVGEESARVERIFSEQLITDTPGIWAPTLAQVLGPDTLLDVLHLAYERGDLFAAAFAFAPLYGVNPYPDWLLAHPRYRELWQRPGMKNLADAWRAVGRVSGLPLELSR